jgi:hypothetical protein
LAAGRLWSYTIDDNPVGFCFAIAGKSLIVVFCVSEVLFGLGLAQDLVPRIQQAFPAPRSSAVGSQLSLLSVQVSFPWSADLLSE